MKSIFALIELDEFSKTDLQDIVDYCRIEGSFAPLCAVAYISAKQEIAEDDIRSLGRLLALYPGIAVNFRRS